MVHASAVFFCGFASLAVSAIFLNLLAFPSSGERTFYRLIYYKRLNGSSTPSPLHLLSFPNILFWRALLVLAGWRSLSSSHIFRPLLYITLMALTMFLTTWLNILLVFYESRQLYYFLYEQDERWLHWAEAIKNSRCCFNNRFGNIPMHAQKGKRRKDISGRYIG